MDVQPDPLPLWPAEPDQQTLVELGRLTVAFALHERALVGVLADYQGVDIWEAVRQNKSKSYKQIKDKIKSYAIERSGRDLIINIFLKRSWMISYERNRLIHGLWAWNDHGGKIYDKRIDEWLDRPDRLEIAALNKRLKILNSQILEYRCTGAIFSQSRN